MHSKNLLEQIPRGITARGVHKSIITYLLESKTAEFNGRILDIPCGHGHLMSTLSTFFPNAEVKGGDISKPDAVLDQDFQLVNANNAFDFLNGKKFDLIMSVSGVMEFDNTLQFFNSCKKHLNADGKFIVTNDNTVSIRDRLSFLFFGKVRQYSNFVNQGDPTWKVIPIHNMVRILKDAGFNILEIRYISIKPKDWLMLPLACFFYPLQYFQMKWSRSTMRQSDRKAMYPFRSFLYRHYFIVSDLMTVKRPASGHF